MAKEKIFTALLLTALLATSVFAHTPLKIAGAQEITSGGTLYLAVPNTIDNFNEFLTNSFEAWYFLQTMYPDAGVPVASGIDHVAVQSYWANVNATVWYFRLRPGMVWSDGVPVNATDLAYSYQQEFSNYSWGAGGMFSDASYLNGSAQTAIKADNASVVEVDLKQPLGLLGDIIGTELDPTLVPYHIWKDRINNTVAPGNMFDVSVGAGPFYVSGYHQGDQQIVMLRNPYASTWGGNGTPHLDKIVVSLVPASSDLAVLLKSGQIDAAPIAPGDVAGLLTDPDIKIDVSQGIALWYIEFPIGHYPYNVTAFRQALDYAIDKQALVTQALSGYGEVGNAGWIHPENSPEFNSSVTEYNYSVTTAKSLLTGIGFKMGSDGFFTLPNGTVFQPTLYVPSENTPIVLAGELVVRDLQAAGIDAQLRPIAFSSMGSVWYQGTNMYFEEDNNGFPNSEVLTDYSFYSYLVNPGPIAGGGDAIPDPVVSQEYNNTVSAINQAGSAQLKYQLEQNIQGLIAKYLPSIPLFYPDFIWGFNTAQFAGWPNAPSAFELPGAVWNLTALATIHLAASTAQTTTSSSSSTSSGTGTAQTTTSSSSSTSSGTGTPLLIVATVAVIIIAAAAIVVIRRRR